MSNHPGDLAESVADDLSVESSMPDEPEDDLMPEGDEPLDSEQPYVFASKIRFALKTDDAEILRRCRRAADSVFQKLFADAIVTIDNLYLAMRVPQRDPNSGRILTDSGGRTVWETDETGNPVEDIHRVSGADLDNIILKLEYQTLCIIRQVTNLRLEALQAQTISKDSFDDAWAPTRGTETTRKSAASAGSREDRWFSFYRYYIYATANAFLSEIRLFTRRLDSIRYRSLRPE